MLKKLETHFAFATATFANPACLHLIGRADYCTELSLGLSALKEAFQASGVCC